MVSLDSYYFYLLDDMVLSVDLFKEKSSLGLVEVGSLNKCLKDFWVISEVFILGYSCVFAFCNLISLDANNFDNPDTACFSICCLLSCWHCSRYPLSI